MSRKGSITKNYLYDMSYQIVALLTPLITAPYISRVLGPEGVGKYSYTASITTYFITLALLGSIGYARREIAYQQENKENFTRIFWEMVVFRACSTAISMVLFYLSIQNQEEKQIYLVQSINILSVAFDITWFYQGLEEFKKIVLRNYIIRIFNVLLIFLLVRNRSDLNLYIFLMAFLTLVGNISMWRYLPRYLSKISWRNIQPFKHWKGILKLFVPTIAVAIYSALDKTMIGLFDKTSLENGYYEQADKLVKIVLTIITSLVNVMTPRISKVIAQKDNTSLKYYMYQSYQFAWFITIPMCMGIYAVSSMIVPWFYGDLYGKTITLLRILCFIIPAIGISNITGIQYMIIAKKERVYTRLLFIGAFVNFIFNMCFIPFFFSTGAAISSVLAEWAIALSGLVFICFIEKDFSFIEIVKNVPRYLFNSILMVIILTIIKFFLNAGIIESIILIITGIAIYLGLLLLQKDKFMKEAINRFMGLR